MNLDRPLDDVLSGSSEVRVLRALEEMPLGLPASAREVGRRAGISHPTASRVLASLTAQGLVRARRAPRGDAFELNHGHVLAGGLMALFEIERRVRQELLRLLAERLEELPVLEAFLFGSARRSEMTAESDVDLAVICAPGDVALVEEGLERLEDAVRERFGSRLSALVGTAPLTSLMRPGRAAHRLWRRIAAEGLPIIPMSTVTEVGA